MVTHGESKTKLNKVWRNMKDRCYNPNNKRFKHYGGRGIAVCTEWFNYEPFRDWAISHGYREGMSIDRIDNDGNYCPKNCRWTDSKTQNNNFSRNRKITYNGDTHSISEWSKVLRINRNTLVYRISSGWGIEEAFFTKADVANKSKKTKLENFLCTAQPCDTFQVREDGLTLG